MASSESRVARTDEGPLCADIVAKVFLGWRTKILRAADALYARQLEGPYRFIQNRSRASAVALKSDAAAEKSRDQLSRDFPGRSIFDICNNIGPKAAVENCPPLRPLCHQKQTITTITMRLAGDDGQEDQHRRFLR